MLTSVKNKAQRNELISLLTFIVAGTLSAAGFAFVPKAEAEKLHKAEPTFITLDATVKNDSGQIKAVATQVAIDALALGATETVKSEGDAVGTIEPNTFEMGFGVVPDIQRGGAKSDSYPFASLSEPKVDPSTGQKSCAFFFIAATEAFPNPAKRLASTVASATKRYKDQTPPRQFTIRKVVDADKKVLGARVYRTV